jgi:hypothetical protein
LQKFEGSWAKIQRANDRINQLDAEIAKFLHQNANHYETLIERDDTALAFILRARGEPLEVPSYIQVSVGEIIYHLRSSLDLAIWELVTEKNSNPGHRVQFPICLTSDSYQKARKEGFIRGLPERFLGIVESAQPYKAHAPEGHPLYILNKLCNTDKHRLLIIGFGIVGSPKEIMIDPGGERIGITGMSPPRFVMPTPEGVEVMRITFTKFHEKTSVQFNAPPLAVFNEFGVSKLEPITDGLKTICNYVTATLRGLEI